jgi:hypothetical protein
VLTEKRLSKLMFHGASILLGWLYLGQMEWYIGMEFFRWACIFLLTWRGTGALPQKIWQTIQRTYPALAIPVFFLTWRIFFFQAERGATDVKIQFENLKLYPLQTVYHWAVQVLQDIFDVMLSAWAIPLSQLKYYIQSGGVLLAIISAGMLIFVMAKLKEALQKSTKPERKQQATGWKIFKSPDPAAGGNVLYVFIIDPAVKDADYTVSNVLAEAFPPAELNTIYKQYADSYAQGQNIINLNLVLAFK